MATADSIPAEEWRPAPGFEDRYSVSNLGRVRRDRSRYGAVMDRIVPVISNKTGYCRVHLMGGSNRSGQVWVFVHQLVARAFLGPPEEGTRVNHKNCNKQDNHSDNLEWVTPLQNARHAVKNGRYPRGDRHGTHTRPETVRRGSAHHNSKLTETAVADIKVRLTRGESGAAIARLHGVSRQVIHGIKRGKAWEHVRLAHGQ